MTARTRSAVHLQLVLLCLYLALVSSCTTTKVRDEPLPLPQQPPLAEQENPDLELTLTWVVIPNGPGSWCSNGGWDEYLILARNRTSDPMKISSVKLFDAHNKTVHSSNQWIDLIEQSVASVKAFEDSGVELNTATPGNTEDMVTWGQLLTSWEAGILAYLALNRRGINADSDTASVATTAAGVGLMVGGAFKGAFEEYVAKTIDEKSIRYPSVIEPGMTRLQRVFFPITPAPKYLMVHYNLPGKRGVVHLDIQKAMAEFHFPTPAE